MSQVADLCAHLDERIFQYMGWIVFAVIVILAVGIVLCARWMQRKHAQESIYEADEGSQSHKKNPFFQQRISGGMRGGPW